jgi:hypothetical protein
MLGGTRFTSKTVPRLARGEAGDEVTNPKGFETEAEGMKPKFGGVTAAPAVATDDPNWGRAPTA